MTAPVTIVFTSAFSWQSFAVFNDNAFPEETRKMVAVCSSRLALFLMHASAIDSSVIRDAADFRQRLQRDREDIELGAQQRPELRMVVVYEGIAHLAEIHSALNAMKSFLDVYAKLVGKLIDRGNEWSFRKAIVGGVKLAGGRFIKATHNSSKTGTHSALADLTLDHTQRWITEAVGFRDQLSHRSDLEGMIRMHTTVSDGSPRILSDQIVMPVMPNGHLVTAYFEVIKTELCSFINSSVRLLPAVDQSLISTLAC